MSASAATAASLLSASVYYLYNTTSSALAVWNARAVRKVVRSLDAHGSTLQGRDGLALAAVGSDPSTVPEMSFVLNTPVAVPGTDGRVVATLVPAGRKDADPNTVVITTVDETRTAVVPARVVVTGTTDATVNGRRVLPGQTVQPTAAPFDEITVDVGSASYTFRFLPPGRETLVYVPELMAVLVISGLPVSSSATTYPGPLYAVALDTSAATTWLYNTTPVALRVTYDNGTYTDVPARRKGLVRTKTSATVDTVHRAGPRHSRHTDPRRPVPLDTVTGTAAAVIPLNDAHGGDAAGAPVVVIKGWTATYVGGVVVNVNPAPVVLQSLAAKGHAPPMHLHAAERAFVPRAAFMAASKEGNNPTLVPLGGGQRSGAVQHIGDSHVVGLVNARTHAVIS